MPHPRNLLELFLNYVEKYDRPDALYVKRSGVYESISTRSFYDHVVDLTYVLWHLGIHKGDRVALLSENRPEWYYADLATIAAGAVDVPIYATLPAGQIVYILKDAETSGVFVSTQEQLEKILEILPDLTSFLHFIIIFATTDLEALPEFARSVQILTLSRALEIGRSERARDPDKFRSAAQTLQPEDLATIIYTSGTTGEPKGVMLSHRNFLSNIEASLNVLDLKSTDLHLSFLPLSHVFERMAGFYTMLAAGARIAFAEDIQKVAENLLEIRPTVIIAVPRFYEKIKSRIDAMTADMTGIKKSLFTWAMNVARRYGEARRAGRKVSPWLAFQYRLADRLVFSKIKARTGGRVRLLVSGAAPLAREIAEFFDNLGLRILEGYGLTETSPVIAVNRANEYKPGTVGKPIPGVEVRIAEDGEILVCGPNVMMGYYKKPEATRATIDPDGWLHTGDIGFLDEDGFLVITDRKKDILVTAGGKNVAPQKIENLLKQHPWIEEAMVVGDGKPYPAAFIVPNMEAVRRFADEQGIHVDSDEQLLEHPEVLAEFEKILDWIQKPLASFERVKRFALIPQAFSIEGGELTPTLKVKRRVVMEKYRHLWPRLYPEAT